MRKLSFFSLVLFISIISSQAQHLGLKIGVNYSNIAEQGFIGGTVGTPIFKYWGNTTGIVGINVGAFARFGKNKLQVQPELIFSMKGFNTEYQKLSFSYVSFPLLIGYSLTPKFTVQVGPEFGYLVSKAPTSVFLFNKKFNALDYGAIAGATVDIFEKIGFNIRYNYGLSNLYDVFGSSETKTWHRTVQASIQYRIK